MINTETWVFNGDVWFAQLPTYNGSVQAGERPVLVVSNNACNKHSSILTVVPISKRVSKKKDFPTHVKIINDVNEENIALCEQILSIDKSLLNYRLYSVTKNEMAEVNKGLRIQLGMEIKKHEV